MLTTKPLLIIGAILAAGIVIQTWRVSDLNTKLGESRARHEEQVLALSRANDSLAAQVAELRTQAALMRRLEHERSQRQAATEKAAKDRHDAIDNAPSTADPNILFDGVFGPP